MTHIDTKVVHHKAQNLEAGNLPLVSPINQSVKYLPKSTAHLREILADRHSGYLYSRVANPTVRELEVLLAGLQGRDDAICLASGIAAMTATVMGLVKSGDHVVMFFESYKPTRYLQRHILARMGVQTELLHLDEWQRTEDYFAAHKPRLMLVESPTNPVLRVPDLDRLGKLCRSHGTLLVLDNTFAGFQHHGDTTVDVFVHSLTKHAGGHSDAMGGVLIANKNIIEQIAPVAITLGATLDPHAAWLILRGMKTYSLRTSRSSQNALVVAKWLKSRKGVCNLRYPGFAEHVDFLVWSRQMKGDGGSVVAFDIKGDQALMDRFIDSLKVFALTPSMGCVESLVVPCLSLFADDLTIEQARRAGISETTVRLSMGIEDANDLILDLDQAFVNVGL